MQEPEARRFFETWFERLWSRLDDTVIDAMCHEQIRVWGLDGPRLGRGQFHEFYLGIRAAFPQGLRIVVDEVMVRGSTVMIRCSAHGRAKNGSEGSCTGFAQATIHDGVMTEAWNCWDFLSLLEQCGGLEAGCLASGMGRLAAS